MDDSQTEWNMMWDGQKFNNTLRDDRRLITWMKCDARLWAIQQHIVTQQLTHKLDEIWYKMVRNSTTPCKTTMNSQTASNVMWGGQKFDNTQDDSQLTNWTKCDSRNSATPCTTMVNSLSAWNVIDARWSDIQQHLTRQMLTHELDGILDSIIYYFMCLVILQHLLARKHPFISFFPTWLPLSLTFLPYIYPVSAIVIPLHAVTHILWHPWVSHIKESTDNSTLTS